MRISLKIIGFIFLMVLSVSKINAQPKCQTYECYLCQWGGEFKVVVPNIFSPNKDNVNDVWFPKVYNEVCLSDYKVSVFNRWGLLLFESYVHNVGWNGDVVDGIESYPEGTYYYLMSYTNGNTKETKTVKGFFQLVR